MNPESRIAMLTAEVRQMRHDLNLLIENHLNQSALGFLHVSWDASLVSAAKRLLTIGMVEGSVPPAPVRSNEVKGLTGNTTAKTLLLTSGGWHDLPGLSPWFLWNGSDFTAPVSSTTQNCVIRCQGLWIMRSIAWRKSKARSTIQNWMTRPEVGLVPGNQS